MEENNKIGFLGKYRRTPAYKICGYVCYALLVLFAGLVYYALNFVSGLKSLLFLVILLFVSPFVFVLFFIILSIIAYITREKYFNLKSSIAADIGYILMLLVTLVSLFFACLYVKDRLIDQPRREKHRVGFVENAQNRDKYSCRVLNDILPSTLNKLGGDFNSVDFSKDILLKNTSIIGSDYNPDKYIIKFYVNNPKDVYHKNGTSTMLLHIIRSNAEKPCNIGDKNCYLYIDSPEYEGVYCKYYFDKAGKVLPSDETLDFIK